VARASRIAATLVALIVLLVAAAERSPADRDHRGRHGRHKVWPRLAYPQPRAIHRAEEYAASRGAMAFAVIDRSIGLRGYEADTQYSSASVSKALLLAAELRRLERAGEPLDSATKAFLEPMITYSDNRSGDAIYARVGDAGLREVASRAGMRNFEPIPGFWGGDKVTAADLARFFYRLDAAFPHRYRAYAKRLLAGITPVERWGIPQAAGRGWSIWFKGGWRPPGEKNNSGPVTHQAALLVHQSGERLALAVLTDEIPGAGGISAIEEIARLLLSKPPPHRGGWATL